MKLRDQKERWLFSSQQAFMVDLMVESTIHLQYSIFNMSNTGILPALYNGII